MDLNEAAEYTGLEKHTLLTLVHAKKIYCLRHHGRLEISKTAADAYLHRHNTISLEEIQSITGVSLCILA